MTKRVFDFTDGFTSDSDPTGQTTEVGAVQDIVASGSIALLTGGSPTQIIKVQGDGVAVVASSTPFGTVPPASGTIIVVRGKDSTNTVTIEENDAANGVLQNGDAILGEDDIISYYYDGVDARYVELNRSF